MNKPLNETQTSRRDFIKTTGYAAAASALAGVALPPVHAASSELIQIALIGCGGRGSGAADNALSTKTGPIKLVAMADVFDDKLTRSHDQLQKKHAAKVEVPDDRKFIGFDGYKKAMDCLRPGDIAVFATPPAFRWVHFKYAIEKGLNVFMEKPVTVDGPTTRRMLELGAESVKKGLKVGVGLMVRHCRGRQELYKRIQDGEIGDLIMLRAYRMSRVSGLADNRGDMSELMFQIRKFHGFLWASGGVYSDYYIHQIDECSWMKNAWPVKAHAIAGRHYRESSLDQNFDNYSVEYTYPDGTKLFLDGRNVSGCYAEMASYAHGTKGSAVISTSGHSPGKVRTYKGHTMNKEDLLWAFPQPEIHPHQLEWDDLVEAVQKNTPYNEVERGAMASLVTSMGRMASHTGQVITLDQIMNCPHEFAPDVAELTMDGPAPLKAGPDGKYPQPQPGIVKDREY